MRCQGMIRFQRYEGLRKRLVPILRFVQTTLNDGGLILEIETMLCQLECNDGNFKEATDRALRAMKLIGKGLVSQGIKTMAALVHALKRMVAKFFAPPSILEVTLLIE